MFIFFLRDRSKEIFSKSWYYTIYGNDDKMEFIEEID